MLIVDDHPLMRLALRQVVESLRDCQLSGDVDGVAGALHHFAEHAPDLVLLDIYLGSGNGLQVIEQIRRRCRDTRILVISSEEDSIVAERALRLGANGYMLKNEEPAALKAAISQTLAGARCVSSTLAVDVIDRMRMGKDFESPDELGKLSGREREVFDLLANAHSMGEIAEKLKLSVKTVEYYRTGARKKLNLKDSKALLLYAGRRQASQ